MTYPAQSPAATPGVSGNMPPICQNCTTSTTPLWRRDEVGSVLCNACGLFLKLHGTPRPISLKTDVIKSRNRVKTAVPGQKRKSLNDANGQPISDAGASPPPHRRVRRNSAGPSDRSRSPVSRTITPAMQHPPNIAPQHMFDGATLNDHAFLQSPSLPSLNLRQPSPASTSSQNDRNIDRRPTYEQLQHDNTALKTRVSELEVINILYKGQVGEQDEKANKSDQQLRQLLEEAHTRENDLKQQVEDLQREVLELREGEAGSKRQSGSEVPEYPDPTEHATAKGMHG